MEDMEKAKVDYNVVIISSDEDKNTENKQDEPEKMETNKGNETDESEDNEMPIDKVLENIMLETKSYDRNTPKFFVRAQNKRLNNLEKRLDEGKMTPEEIKDLNIKVAMLEQEEDGDDEAEDMEQEESDTYGKYWV